MGNKLDVVNICAGNSGLSWSEQQPHMRSCVKSVQRLSLLACWSHIRVSGSAELEMLMSWGSRETVENTFCGWNIGGSSGQDSVRFVRPECINTKLFGIGRLPQELPISPQLPELSSPGPLSICAKFIRLLSVCVAIMAAPSCCSSKGPPKPCTDAAEVCVCSQLLTLADCSPPEKAPQPLTPLNFRIQH